MYKMIKLLDEQERYKKEKEKNFAVVSAKGEVLVEGQRIYLQKISA